jgi:hypothetical protein
VQCGFNQKLGRQMTTVSSTSGSTPFAGAGGGGHGSVASTLMERAARVIEEEAEAERTKTTEGFPWYGYAGMLLGALAFMAAMRFVPHQTAMQLAAAVGMFLGAMIQLYADIRILIIAFKEGIGHGLGCFFCGCYGLYYVITRWDMCAGFVGLWCIGWGIGFFAQMMLYVAASFSGGEEQESSIQQPAPNYAVVQSFSIISVPLLRSGASLSNLPSA